MLVTFSETMKRRWYRHQRRAKVVVVRWHEFENQGIIQRWPWVKTFVLMSLSRNNFNKTIKIYLGDGLGSQRSGLLRIC